VLVGLTILLLGVFVAVMDLLFNKLFTKVL